MKTLAKPAKPLKLVDVKMQVWKLFSRYIRLRDCLSTTGTTVRGKCYTCDIELPFTSLQAGHFVAGRHNGNLFSERGCHAQCAGCNIYKHSNPLVYRRRVIAEYGPGADESLEAEAAIVRKFTIPELLALKESLQKRIAELEIS